MGVQQVDEVILPVVPPSVPRSKSLPNLVTKSKKPNPLDRDPSDAINIIQEDASRRMKSQSLKSSSNSESPDRLPALEELTGIATLPELPSFADFEELEDALELPECPAWDVVQEPTAGTGEEWWEVLFEGIGIVPLVQPPYNEEHPYAMEDLQGEASGSGEVR